MISKYPKMTGPLWNTSAKLALTNAIKLLIPKGPTLSKKISTTPWALICFFKPLPTIELN
jgi:hypothetical protein